jgi:GTP-binding protein
VRRELRSFAPDLVSKPQLVAANKIDALDDPERAERLAERAAQLSMPFFRISGVTGEGVPELLEALWRCITGARRALEVEAASSASSGPAFP